MTSKSHSESLTRIEYQEISHSWRIENFSMCSKKIKEFIESEDFPKEDKDQWRLQLYPSGCNEVSKDYISVFLEYIPREKSNMKVQYKFNFQNNVGKVIKYTQYSLRDFEKDLPWGYRTLIKRDELLPQLLDDVLIFNCTIKWEVDIKRVHDEKKSPLAKPNAQENLSNSFLNLMESGTLSDVNLVAKDDNKFPAHKSVLAARSPVFSVMFEDNTRDGSKSVVEIKDVDTDVLKNLLKFMYTGKVDLKNCEVEGLLIAADKYGIEDLKVLCELELVKRLNVDNAITLLLLADRQSATTLKTQALKFISRNLKDVLKTDAMKNLTITQTSIFYEILETVAE